IGKYNLSEKCFGIFDHSVKDPTVKLVRGFDEVFRAPHSRHTTVLKEEIEKHPDLQILSESDEAGIFMVKSRDDKHIMVTGHLEYEATTLKEEYERDQRKGLAVMIPEHYFPNNDPAKRPLNTWRSHTHLLFTNW